MGSPFPAIETLVPHRPPILLVETVLACDETSARCIGRIRRSSPYATQGRASVVLGLEMAAQGASAFEALRSHDEATPAGPRHGYLASIRDARFHADALPVDVGLQVEIRRTGGMHPLAIYRVTVADPRRDDESLLDATLGLFAQATDPR